MCVLHVAHLSVQGMRATFGPPPVIQTKLEIGGERVRAGVLLCICSVTSDLVRIDDVEFQGNLREAPCPICYRCVEGILVHLVGATLEKPDHLAHKELGRLSRFHKCKPAVDKVCVVSHRVAVLGV